MTMRRFFGKRKLTFRRLCSRAPRITMSDSCMLIGELVLPPRLRSIPQSGAEFIGKAGGLAARWGGAGRLVGGLFYFLGRRRGGRWFEARRYDVGRDGGREPGGRRNIDQSLESRRRLDRDRSGGYLSGARRCVVVRDRFARGSAKRLALGVGLQRHPPAFRRAATALSDQLPRRAKSAAAYGASPHAAHVQSDSQSRTFHVKFGLSRGRLVFVHSHPL